MCGVIRISDGSSDCAKLDPQASGALKHLYALDVYFVLADMDFPPCGFFFFVLGTGFLP